MHQLFSQQCCKTVFFSIKTLKLKGGGAPCYHPLRETLNIHLIMLIKPHLHSNTFFCKYSLKKSFACGVYYIIDNLLH